MTFKKKLLAASVSFGMIGSVQAVTLDEANTLEDLKEVIRMQQKEIANMQSTATPKRMIKSGKDNVRLSISGHANRAISFTDDDENTDSSFVDADQSVTRIRFRGEGDVNDDLTVGAYIETGLSSNNSYDVNQNNSNSSDLDDWTKMRWAEVYFDTSYGKVSLGQGSFASNDTAEYDLSVTGMPSYSSVADPAGGFFWYFEDLDAPGVGDGLNPPGVTIGDTFANFDGLSRDDRLRYDSPTFAGFQLATSWGDKSGENDAWDIAANYEGSFGDFDVIGAIAYWDNQKDDNDGTVNGSFSIKHSSGFGFSAAGANQEADDGGAIADESDDRWYGYGKIFYDSTSLTSIGTTAFALDYYYGESIGSQEKDDALDNGESTSYAFTVVQTIDDFGTELYAVARGYEYELDDSPIDDPEDFYVLQIGSRVKF